MIERRQKKNLAEMKKTPNFAFAAVCVLFLLSAVYYGQLAVRMSSIVFFPGDENRFLAMAKSLHFLGRLQEGYQIVKYDDILYSGILSAAYFFYSPERILTLFRLIGVVLMSSAVFPVYLLSRRLNVGKLWRLDGAVVAAALSVLIPEMTYSAYLLEEVLLYPLFLWMLYFAHVEFSEEKNMARVNGRMILLLFLMYASKTFAIVFAGAYCMVKFFHGLRKDKKAALSAVLSGGIFLGLVILLKLVLWMMNGMQTGTSHYSDQVLTIFPFTFQVLVGIVRGLLFYGGYFLLFTGVLPFLVLCSRLKTAEKRDMLWGVFLLASILFAILEVTVIIHYSENGKDQILSRFHYRYLFYFFIPLMLFFLKYKYVLKKALTYGLLAFEAVVLLLFFVPVNSAGQGICDGIVCYLVKQGSLTPGFSDTFCAVLLLLLAAAAIMLHTGREKVLYVFGLIFTMGGAVLTLPFASRIPLQYSDSTYYEDYIKIAEYVNGHEGKVLCVSTDRWSADPVLRSGAYHTKDFQTLYFGSEDPVFTVGEDNTLVLILGDYRHELAGNLERVDIGTEAIRLYLADRGTVYPDSNSLNITFSNNENLINGWDEGGRRYLTNGGVSYGPYVKLSAGEYEAEISGDSLSQALFLCYCGTEMYPLTQKKLEDGKAVFTFRLPADVEEFEFSVRNMQDGTVIVDRIFISAVRR